VVDVGRVISTALRFIDGFTKPSQEVIKSMSKMADNMKRNARDIQKAGKAISSVGSAMTKAITVPITGVATAAVKTAADFETAMSQVAATMGKTKDDIKGLSELAQRMGATTAFSAREAAEGINILAMAGLNATQIGDSLGTVLDLAAAGAMDMGSSASYIVGAVKGFGDEMKNASTYADLMAKGATMASTDVTALGEAISYGAATAAGYSQSVDSMTLSLLRMAEQNVTGQTAATSLNRAMTDLYAPTAEAKKALDSLGISVYNADGNAKDFNIVVDELSGALKRMSEQQANALKSTIFTTNGMNAFNKMTASTSERVKELKEGLRGSYNSAATQAKTQLDNLNGQLTLLKSALEATAITIGNKLLPYISKAVGWVQTAFEWINSLNDAQVENIMKWAGIVAAIGPAILIFGKMVTMVGTIQKTYAGAIKIFTQFKGILGVITSPAGIVIGVLAAIALAAFLIIKNWDQVKGFLQGVGSWFKNAFEKAGFSVEGFKSKFTSIGNTIGSIAGKISGFCESIAGIFKKEFAGSVKEGVTEVGGVLETLVGGAVAAFDGIVTAVDRGLRAFDALLDFFTGAFAGNWDSAAQGFRNSLENIFPPDMAAGLTKAFDNALPVIKTLVSSVKAAFDGIVTAVDRGLRAFGALLDFFAGAFAGNWDSAAQGFRNSLENIFPPDMAAGLTKAFDNVLPAIKAVVSGVKAAFSGLVEDVKKIFAGFTTIFKGIGTMLKGIFSGDAETALKGFQAAAGGVVDTIGDIFKAKINAIKNFVVGAFSTFLPEGAVNKIAGAFDVVASAWDTAIGAAKGCINGFVQAVRPVIENIKTIFSGVGQFIKGVFTGDWKGALNGLKTIASGALSGLVNAIKAPFTLIADTVKGAANTFKSLNIVKTIFTGIGNAIGKALTKCGVDMDKFSANISNIKARVSSIINNLKTIFNTVFGAIGKAVRAVAKVVANIFGKEISSTCSTAKAVIIAFKAVAGAAFSWVAGVVKKAMNIIVPVVKVAFGAIKGAVSAAVNTITSIISGVLTVFDGLTAFISGVFTGDWKQAWEGVKSIFKGIFDTFAAICKAPVNAVIGVINGAISALNKINVTIPDWVPGLGGKSFGINIPTIPQLYKGTDNWRGGAAVIHDRGGEIVDLPKGSRVYPHDKSVEMARKEGERNGSGSVQITIQKLADKIEVRSDEDIDRIAEALAYKLKKIAFNTGTA